MNNLLDKCIIHNIYFSILSFIAIGLIIASFIVPPIGVIDPSILAGTGEIFAFAALGSVYKAMDRDKGITMSHGNTSITIDGKKYKIQKEDGDDN